ncbi:MAG: aspartate kinase [Anaerolineae bacterium]|nr:aspartate kinase [Anaerolineae bacterium]
MGRGGSDYSATYLGALLKADEIWFFTDVDGLMTADPEVISNARVIPSSSYAEIAEMAHFGARVVHPRAMEPLMKQGIPLRIRSVDHLGVTGTYIFANTAPTDHRIHAVTHVRGIVVHGPTQSNMAEACNRVLSSFLLDEIEPTLQAQTYGSSLLVYLVPTSANRFSFDSYLQQLRNYDTGDDWRVNEVIILAVIGSLRLVDMAQVLTALAAANIQPIAFGQGQRGVFMVCITPQELNSALQTIHRLIP